MAEAGQLVTLDAADTLAELMVGDHPDPARFDAAVGEAVRDALVGGRRVRAHGEMVALLWDAGNVGAAIELEDLWNELGARIPLACSVRTRPTRSMAMARSSTVCAGLIRRSSASAPIPHRPRGPPPQRVIHRALLPAVGDRTDAGSAFRLRPGRELGSSSPGGRRRDRGDGARDECRPTRALRFHRGHRRAR